MEGVDCSSVANTCGEYRAVRMRRQESERRVRVWGCCGLEFGQLECWLEFGVTVVDGIPVFSLSVEQKQISFVLYQKHVFFVHRIKS